jgi:lysophospholipase L1-like esterase
MFRKSHLLGSLVAAAALLFASRAFAADAAVQPNDFLAITGDSITEQKIYSVFMEDYILMCKPVANVRTMQFGWSGDTTWGFVGNKLDNDVLRFHPTVATTCFGMNDGAYSKLNDATVARYRDSTQAIVDKMKAGGVRTIIIGSAGSVGAELKKPNATFEVYNQTLAGLRDVDKELAAKNNVIFADVFTPLVEANAKAKQKYGDKYQLNGGDGIHPSQNGHLIMAYAFLKAMGFSGEIGTITVDLSNNSATASDGHKILSDQDGTIAIESSKYPFCFTGKPEESNSTTGVIEFFPFNQDLNRFTLIVKNPQAERMKVSWGSSSKEFTAADLAKGINLAAEFLDNPFSEQFQKVHQAVAAQQAFETPFIKNFVVNFPSFKKMVGDEDQQAFDHLADSGAQKDKGLFDEAAALVTPVTHTIKIEAVK